MNSSVINNPSAAAPVVAQSNNQNTASNVSAGSYYTKQTLYPKNSNATNNISEALLY